MRPKTPFNEVIILLIIIAASIMLAVGIFLLLAPGNDKTGKDTASGVPDSLSVSLEKKLGGLIKSQLDAENRYLTQPVITSALKEIQGRLLPLIKDNPFQVQILVLESPTVNALAFPGGLIIIFSSLIKYTDNAGQLAGIIAHELGHVIHRDAMNLLARNFTVAFLLNIISGGRSPELVNEIINDLVNSNYSREQEQSADSFAFDLLIRAGINPLHLAEMFEKFQKISGSDEGILKYFNTHPPLAERRRKALESSLEFSKLYPEEKKLSVDWIALKRSLPSPLD
jgi:predicted Zn-dependent protease